MRPTLDTVVETYDYSGRPKGYEMTYYIYEKQNANSVRAYSHAFAGTLTQAKRFASRQQVWQGTVLEIETETGLPVSRKEHGKWIDIFYRGQEYILSNY